MINNSTRITLAEERQAHGMTEFILKDRPFGVRPDVPVPRAAKAAGVTSFDIVSNDAEDAIFFRSLEQQGIYLNTSQIQAVRHGDGPLLTIAGAGSGKTSVLVSRTGYLITMRQVAPRNILLVTFTSRAAAEMKDRIARLPGISRRAAQEVQARTFHAFFLMILKHHGYTQRLLSEARIQQIMMKRILRELNLQASYEPETVLDLLSSYKMKCISLAELPEKTFEERDLKTAMQRYEAWKKDTHQMDFDDVLVFAHELLTHNKSLLASLQRRFQYVMADEFQDTNYLQYVLLRLIVAGNRNLMVVGDDDQTIYTFNGADHTFILNFQQEYPNARTITLDINYRSNAHIVGLGNAIIEHNVERKIKTLKIHDVNHSTAEAPNDGQPKGKPLYIRPSGTDEEAESVAMHIMEQVTAGRWNYRDIAILHRTASSSRAMFEQLVLRDMPFVQYGAGSLFYEQWLVKPVIDHLRLAMNPRNKEAAEHVVAALYIHREHGTAFMLQEDQKHPKKYPLIHLQNFPGLKSFQKDSIKERIRLIKSLKAMKPVYAIQEIRRQFYEKYIEVHDAHRWTDHKETLAETLDELESAAKRFDTVEAFLGFIDEMAAKHAEMQELMHNRDADAITLMTIHRSKGLEYPCVYVIGASEGILPHSSALQVESDEDSKLGRDSRMRARLAKNEQNSRLTLGNRGHAGDNGKLHGQAGRNDGSLHADGRAGGGAGGHADGRARGNVNGGAGGHASGGAALAAGAGAAQVNAALEEERRLAYVAVTRAREELYISSPAHYRGKKADVSRFFAAAFGADDATRRRQTPSTRATQSRVEGAPPAHSTRVLAGGGRAAAKPAAALRSVRAWLCTDASCPAWMRISPSEAADAAASKACPLCGKAMARGERDVPAH